MVAIKLKSRNIIYVVGGVLIAYFYISSNKNESEPPPVGKLPVNLSESGYNGVCAGILSIERNINFSDVVFRKFYLSSSPVVNVSHEKNNYECKFFDGLVTFRTSKDGGNEYSNWVNTGEYGYTYRFKPSLSEKLVNIVAIDSKEQERLISFEKVTSANVDIDAKQINNVELNKVCQYAIGLEFSKKPSTIKIKDPYNKGYNSIKVGYVRSADNTTWNYECEINKYDNKVLWRVLPGSNVTDVGRWRDGSNGFKREDSDIRYKVLKNTIEVSLKYYDGSGDVSKFRR